MTSINGDILKYHGRIKIEDLTGCNHLISLPAIIDIKDSTSIGKMILFSSFSETHGLISVGLHIVLMENRIE